MAAATPRWIIVDDGDPLVNYNGPWAVQNANSDIYGGPFNATLHGLSGNGSFTFNFTGKTKFRVITHLLGPHLLRFQFICEG